MESRLYICYVDEVPVYCSSYKKHVYAYLEEKGIPVDSPQVDVRLEHKRFLEEDCIATATRNFQSILRKILLDVDTEQYLLFFTGKDNFRKEIYPEYKANRPVDTKPLLYGFMKDWVQHLPNVRIVNGMEADDALSLAQTKETVICSIDKDLLMIPGNHYNINKQTFSKVTPEDGIRHFYKQLLTGDAVDNIPGLKGFGPKKAEMVLEPCGTPVDMYRTIFDAYMENKGLDEKHAGIETLRNGRLLWMTTELHKDGSVVLWEPPDGV